MSGGDINAEKCATYLRAVGVEVTPETEAQWVEAQREHREANRIRNRELKKSCGHFRTYICRIISAEGGDEAVTTCHDCHRWIARKPWTTPPPLRRKPLPAERSA